MAQDVLVEERMETSVDHRLSGRHRHGKRLSELGGQIARVAHELNAPVSLIAGSLGALDEQFDALLHYVEATRLHAARDPELSTAYASNRIDYVLANARALLAICDEGVQRVGHVVDQLRSYARRARPKAVNEALDVGDILSRALRLATKGRSLALAVDRQIEAPLPSLFGDAEVLGQAFLNLLTNAIDAVKGVPDPHIVISARPTADGDGVEIRISDNGPGVASSQRAAVFEPFFTTKSAGTGLGLAIAKEAIEHHGGTIGVADTDRPGAEFIVELRATT